MKPQNNLLQLTDALKHAETRGRGGQLLALMLADQIEMEGQKSAFAG